MSPLSSSGANSGVAVEVTYYTGTWASEDRAAVVAALRESGLHVTSESGGGQKSVTQVVAPQLLLEVAERVLTDTSAIVGLVLGARELIKLLRRSKPDASVQILGERRIYLIDVSAPDAEMAADAIPDDLSDADESRKGDMVWRDGKWRTIEER